MWKRIKVCSYSRVLPVSMQRMFENAYDWEHLPYLHHKSFCSLKLKAKTSNSWQAEVILVPGFLGLYQKVSLRGDIKRGIWITRILDGFQKGTVILSKAVPLHKHKIKVQVDFFLPRRLVALSPAGFIFRFIYKRLYDEDEAMMVERQKQLDIMIDAQAENSCHWSLVLGQRNAILRKINSSSPVIFHNKSDNLSKYRLLFEKGEFHAISCRCPHMLADLSNAAIKKGKIICPWHGYKFDLRTGSCSDKKLKLKIPPKIITEDGIVRAVFKK